MFTHGNYPLLNGVYSLRADPQIREPPVMLISADAPPTANRQPPTANAL